jgi:hypothetical protein
MFKKNRDKHFDDDLLIRNEQNDLIIFPDNIIVKNDSTHVKNVNFDLDIEKYDRDEKNAKSEKIEKSEKSEKYDRSDKHKRHSKS